MFHFLKDLFLFWCLFVLLLGALAYAAIIWSPVPVILYFAFVLALGWVFRKKTP